MYCFTVHCYCILFFVQDEHEDVAETAVVSFPHDVKGEGIFAFVTLKEKVRERGGRLGSQTDSQKYDRALCCAQSYTGKEWLTYKKVYRRGAWWGG